MAGTIVHISLVVCDRCCEDPPLLNSRRGAGVGGEITPEQPARLKPNSPGPFEPRYLHPYRRPGSAPRQEIEQSAGGLDDTDIGQARREFVDKSLFVGNAERHPQIVRRQRVDFVDLGPQRLAPQIAVAASDDPQVGTCFPDIGDGGCVFCLIRAEHIERQPRGCGLAGDDIEQVGGGDALRQRCRRVQPRGGNERLSVGIDEIGRAEQPAGHRFGRTARQHLAIG